MDFFASQDLARRKTKWLVLYFVLAVVAMITLIYLAVSVTIYLASLDTSDPSRPAELPGLWNPPLLIGIALLTVGTILSGSLYKTWELHGSGEQVALQLGGRRIAASTSDEAERRLLNIVEEMAIASGISVPPVYVLDNEDGINAFAAGLAPNDAIIGVNRGTLDYLSRDELQGVIAHEFSHIFHGDMRLNLRLIGLLHGILLVSMIGYYILRIAPYSGSRSSNSRGKAGGMILLLVLGIAMMLVGWIGLACARLIKSAISRQREFLADASAVQFTRNPAGIAGALKTIGGLTRGSRIDHPEAEVASHMFFGASSRVTRVGPFATHPPLATRIRRIDPQFDGRFPRVPLVQKRRTPAPREKASVASGLTAAAAEPLQRLSPVLAMQAIGTVQPAAIEHAARLISSLPDGLRTALHDPFSGRAVIMAWLLDRSDPVLAHQREVISTREGQATLEEVERLRPVLERCSDETRLPALEILQNTLGQLSAEQYDRFRGTVTQLVEADRRVVLAEFVMQRILLTHLDRHFSRLQPPPTKFYSVNAVGQPAADLLSILTYAGNRDPQQSADAYRVALATLGLRTAPLMRTRKDCTLERLNAALDRVERAAPMVKRRVLAALLAAAAHDEMITVREAEMLRSVAVAIDCPVPPLLPGSTPALAGAAASAGR